MLGWTEMRMCLCMYDSMYIQVISKLNYICSYLSFSRICTWYLEAAQLPSCAKLETLGSSPFPIVLPQFCSFWLWESFINKTSSIKSRACVKAKCTSTYFLLLSILFSL